MIPQPANDPTELRRKAEARLKARPAASRPSNEADLRRLLHELEIHQTELKLRIEELAEANQRLQQEARQRQQLEETQEARVAATTAEFRQTNQDLQSARAAALNLMEDAVAAQHRSEATTEALRESEQRYRLLADNTADVIWLMSPQMVFTYVNPAIEALTGYPPEAWVGSALGDHCDARNLQLCGEVVRQALEQLPANPGITFEAEMLRKDGSPIAVEITGKVLLDEQGEVQALQGITRDITERRRADAALRESEARFRAAFEQAAVGVAHVGLDGQWLRVNQKLCEIVGYSTEELLRLTFQDITHPEDLASDLNYVRQLLAGEIPTYAMEKRYIRKDGTPVWINLTVSLVREPSGQPSYFVAVIEDIAQRKLAEAALQDSETRLRTLLRALPLPLCTVTKEGEITFRNDRFVQVFGYTATEVPTLTEWWPRAYPDPHYRQWVTETWNAAVCQAAEANRDIQAVEYKVACKNGDVRTVEISGITLGEDLLATFVDVTERKQAEAVVRQERDFSQAVIDSLPGLFYLFDDQGRFLRVNRNFEKISGYSSDEILRRTPLDFFGGTEKESIAGAIQQVFQTGEALVEAHFQSKDSTRTPYFFTGKLFQFDQKSCVIGMGIDVTARKQAEEQLRASETRFREIFNLAPVSLWEEDWAAVVIGIRELRDAGVTDFERHFREHPELVQRLLQAVKILDVNPETLQLFEARDKGQLLRSLATVFATPDTLPGFVGELLALAAGHPTYRAEMALRTVGGRTIHTLLTMSLPEAQSSNAIVYVSLMDVTARKQAEDALRESEARMRRAIEAAPVPILLHDEDDRILMLSKGWTRYSGYTLEDLPTLADWTERAYGARTGSEKDYIDNLFAINETTNNGEWTVTAQDGTQRIWEFQTTPLGRISAGKRVLLSLAVDVTEKKLAETELKTLNAELEQRVGERTAELQAANEELESFSYSVSHDLRAPLRHINGFVELLAVRARAALDERSRHYLDTIADSAKQMGQLIDDLLIFSRMGRAELRRSTVDLDRLVGDSIRELEPDTRGRNIAWQLHPLPVVLADTTMLHQVLLNLLSNAIKYTRPRAPARIEVGSTDANPHEVAVFVRDNGVGFDPRYTHKLFGVFQRLHRSDEFEGTGIGLANVRRIIHRHGGRTWAEGDVDKGATFYFTLPSPAETPPAPASHKKATT